MTVGIPALLKPNIAQLVETKNVLFDFGALLASDYAAGTIIASIVEINVTVAPGSAAIDPTPQSRLIGMPIIVTSEFNSIANGAVVAWFGTMIGAVTYLLQCVVMLSDGISQPTIEVKLVCYNPNAGS